MVDLIHSFVKKRTHGCTTAAQFGKPHFSGCWFLGWKSQETPTHPSPASGPITPLYLHRLLSSTSWELSIPSIDKINEKPHRQKMLHSRPSISVVCKVPPIDADASLTQTFAYLSTTHNGAVMTRILTSDRREDVGNSTDLNTASLKRHSPFWRTSKLTKRHLILYVGDL